MGWGDVLLNLIIAARKQDVGRDSTTPIPLLSSWHLNGHSCALLTTLLSGVDILVLVIENCAIFVRGSPRFLYFMGYCSMGIECYSNCKLGAS